MGFCPLLVILWAKNDKITFQRNRPKIMEIEKNRKKIEKIFFFQKYQKWVPDAPADLPNGCKHALGHPEPIFDIFEKKIFFRFFFDFFRFL